MQITSLFLYQPIVVIMQITSPISIPIVVIIQVISKFKTDNKKSLYKQLVKSLYNYLSFQTRALRFHLP